MNKELPCNKKLLFFIILIISISIISCTNEDYKKQQEINIRCDQVRISLQNAFKEETEICITENSELIFSIINIGNVPIPSFQMKIVGEYKDFYKNYERNLPSLGIYYDKLAYDKTTLGEIIRVDIFYYINFENETTKCFNNPYRYTSPVSRCLYH